MKLYELQSERKIAIIFGKLVAVFLKSLENLHFQFLQSSPNFERKYKDLILHTDSNHSKMFIISFPFISQVFQRFSENLVKFVICLHFTICPQSISRKKPYISIFRTILTPKNGDCSRSNLWTKILNLSQCVLLIQNLKKWPWAKLWWLKFLNMSVSKSIKSSLFTFLKKSRLVWKTPYRLFLKVSLIIETCVLSVSIFRQIQNLEMSSETSLDVT